MAYQVGTACYATATQAAQAAASAQVGAVTQHASTSYFINAASVDATSITYTLTPVGGGTALTVTAPFTAQPCGLLTFQDGMQMGWLIAAAWIATFAVVTLRHAVSGWGDQSGNT